MYKDIRVKTQEAAGQVSDIIFLEGMENSTVQDRIIDCLRKII